MAEIRRSGGAARPPTAEIRRGAAGGVGGHAAALEDPSSRWPRRSCSALLSCLLCSFLFAVAVLAVVRFRIASRCRVRERLWGRDSGSGAGMTAHGPRRGEPFRASHGGPAECFLPCEATSLASPGSGSVRVPCLARNPRHSHHAGDIKGGAAVTSHHHVTSEREGGQIVKSEDREGRHRRGRSREREVSIEVSERMAASVRTVASLESAFQLTLGEAGAGAGARRQVCISKLQVAHAAVARELFRDKSTWRVTNFDPLVKLERADAILRLLQQLLLPALSANPTSPALLLSLARCCSKLTNCVAAVGGTFVPVGNNLVRSMRQVRDLCANGEHTLPQLAEAVNDLATRVAAVRSTDVQLRVRSTDGQLRD